MKKEMTIEILLEEIEDCQKEIGAIKFELDSEEEYLKELERQLEEIKNEESK